MKKVFILLLALALMAVAVGGYFYAQRQPNLFLPAGVDLSDPTRFVFLSEKESPAAVAVDLHEKRVLGRLRLAFPAAVAVADKGMLAYANGQNLAVQNLATGEVQMRKMPYPVLGLRIAGTTLWTAELGAVHELTIAPLSLQKMLPLAGRFVALHIMLDGRPLVLADLPPAVVTPSGSTLLPPELSEIGASALSPDGRLLAFSAQYRGRPAAVLWSVEKEQVLVVHSTAVPFLRPIFDSQGKAAYFVSRSGDGVKLEAGSGRASVFAVPDGAADIALGFLDRRIIVLGEKGAAILDADSLQSVAQLPLVRPVGLFITADSKIALIGSEGEPVLHVISLRKGIDSPIPLSESIAPTAVFMDAGYALCH